MSKRLFVIAALLCALMLSCTALADAPKATDPLEVTLAQPSAMVAGKPFNVQYTIKGGTAPYDVFVEVTRNGRYVDSFDGNKRTTFTPEETGQYVIIVTVTDAENTVAASRFGITAYDPGTLTLNKLNVAEGSDGASVIATADYSVGQDNATFVFRLYDENDNLLNQTGAIAENTYTFTGTSANSPLTPGVYYVTVVVSDGFTTLPETPSGKITIGIVTDFRLLETQLVYHVSADQRSIYVDQPTAVGGSGSYVYAYMCYNDASRPINYFYSSDPTVAMTPGTGGNYCVFCTVTDGKDKVTLHTDWVLLPSTTDPLTTDATLSIRASSTGREILVTRPNAYGGTGRYHFSYSVYNSLGRNLIFQAADDAEVSLHTGENGHFNVICFVTDGLTALNIVSPWLDLTGYPNRPPMNIGTITATVSGDNRSMYITQPSVTGGTGSYSYFYTCYDELGRNVAFFSSTSATVAMSPGFNGRFVVIAIVSDGVETLYAYSDWCYLSGYTALPDSDFTLTDLIMEELESNAK
ncbi:MAG: hypothetical protein IKP40_04350 [Clostridia bacterium]|nr:hypothetical protein [Clostridia bacterium]